VPRSCGTSISNALYGAQIGHFSLRFLRLVTSDAAKRPLTFCVMRDPIDRCVSSFKFVRAGGAESVKLDSRWRKELANINTMVDYLGYINSHVSKINELDFVMREQVFFVSDEGIMPDYTFVLGVHDLELAAFLLAHDVDELPIENRSFGENMALTEAELALIRQIYRRDDESVNQARLNAQPLRR